jgi:hypothetical protein
MVARSPIFFLPQAVEPALEFPFELWILKIVSHQFTVDGQGLHANLDFLYPPA